MKPKDIDLTNLPEEAQKALQQFPEFDLLEINETGANGFVLLGHHSVLKKNVALKVYFHADNAIDQEPAIIAGIHHENVLKIYDARKVEDNCSYYMMPTADEGDLATYLKKYHLSLCFSHNLLCQLLSGLSALHDPKVGVVHRDLKPENLLVHDDKLMIADFGSVRKLDAATGKAPASKHSILYRPPEAFGVGGFFDQSSDVYQAGLIGYLLLGGALSNDLLSYLNRREMKEFRRITKVCGDFEVSQYVDGCIHRRIENGRVLDWSSLPCFVPRSLRRVVKRATNARENRYESASEFLAELARVRNGLPSWIQSEDGAELEGWNGNDYLLSQNGDVVMVKKRRHGAASFRADKSFPGGPMNVVFADLRDRLGLP